MIELAIIWALCAWFACWRWVQDYGFITLLVALVIAVIAPFGALAALLFWVSDWVLEADWKTPVIWRKK